MSDRINAKRTTRHPSYPSFIYDARTTREVEQTRDLQNHRPRSKAKDPGRPLNIPRDLDGAYRWLNRLDGMAPAGV